MKKKYFYTLLGFVFLYNSTFSSFAYADSISSNVLPVLIENEAELENDRTVGTIGTIYSPMFNLKTSINHIGNSGTIYSPVFNLKTSVASIGNDGILYSPVFSIETDFSIGTGEFYFSNVFNSTSNISISYTKDDQIIKTDSLITPSSKIKINGVYKQPINSHSIKQVYYLIENITTGEVYDVVNVSLIDNSFEIEVQHPFVAGNSYKIVTKSIFDDASFSISESPILTLGSSDINITTPNKEYYLTSDKNNFPLVFDVKSTANYKKVTISIKDIDSGSVHLLVSDVLLSTLQSDQKEEGTIITYKYNAAIPREIKNGKFIIEAF